MQPNERRTLQMCYFPDSAARGLHAVWTGPNIGMQVWSSTVIGPYPSPISPGTQYLTYIRTVNETSVDGALYTRDEWFSQWLSPSVPNSSEPLCNIETAPDWAAKILMLSSFYTI